MCDAFIQPHFVYDGKLKCPVRSFTCRPFPGAAITPHAIVESRCRPEWVIQSLFDNFTVSSDHLQDGNFDPFIKDSTQEEMNENY